MKFYPLLGICFLFAFNVFMGTSSAASSVSVVEISGKKIPEFLGFEIPKITVRVFKAGQWKAIPFQIDEKTSDKVSSTRRWVLDMAFSRRTDLPRGNGKLDEDEVLLFLSKDLGEKAPTFAGIATHGVEVNAGAGFAYLLFEAKQEMKTNQSYMQYDSNADSIDALGYKAHFTSAHAIVQDELIPKNSRSANPLNILDRFKVRMLLALKGLFEVKVEEDNISSTKLGYRVGPIRLIRRITAYKALGPIRVTPKVQSDFVFYPYYVQVPTQLDNPLDGRKYLNENSKGYAGFDFTQAFYGTKFYFQRNSSPVILDGEMSPEEKALITKDVTWWAATGDKGTVLVKMDWDPDLVKAGVTCDLYYMDDRSSLKPPEADPGEAVVGFQLNLNLVPPGNYMIYVTQIFPPLPFSIGDEASILNNLVLKPQSFQSF